MKRIAVLVLVAMLACSTPTDATGPPEHTGCVYTDTVEVAGIPPIILTGYYSDLERCAAMMAELPLNTRWLP